MCLGREFRKRKLPRTSGGEGKCMIKVFLLLLLSSLLRFPPLFFLGSKKKALCGQKRKKERRVEGGVFLRSLSLSVEIPSEKRRSAYKETLSASSSSTFPKRAGRRGRKTKMAAGKEEQERSDRPGRRGFFSLSVLSIVIAFRSIY